VAHATPWRLDSPRKEKVRMPLARGLARFTLLFIVLATLPIPARATTLIRLGLDRLAAENELVAQAKIVEIHSFWNADHTFILTDVRAEASHMLKGAHAADVTFTLMGGAVGDVTTLIIGGPDLVPGSEYVLFLSRGNLPGAPGRLTVRDQSQGVFEVRSDRAFSQASGEPLVPDANGMAAAPGGEAGLTLDELARQVRHYSDR